MRLPLANRVETALVLTQRGLVRPVRPDRLLQMGLAFRHWGVSVAAAVRGQRNLARPTRSRSSTTIGRSRTRRSTARTNALANELARLGLGERDRLAILCRNESAFVESVVACAKLGADVLPLNTSFAAGELAAVIEREQPPVLIHDAEFAEIVAGARLG